MSRDPMAVLRLAASMAECGVPQAEVDEAIAQVEALEKSLRDMTREVEALVEDGTLPPFAMRHKSMVGAYAALAPFTAGQDSEGAA